MKENETVLLTVASGILLGQWLDIYWVVYPAFSPEAAVLSWNELGIGLGFIGLFGWTVQSFLARHPVANPTGQIVFRRLASGGSPDYGDDLSVLGDEVIPVEPKENDHREERHALVAIVEGMIAQ